MSGRECFDDVDLVQRSGRLSRSHPPFAVSADGSDFEPEGASLALSEDCLARGTDFAILLCP